MNYSYPVIDGHYHILGGWNNSAGQDFITSTRAYRKSRGFETLNICAVPFLDEYHTDVSNNILAALCKLRMPELYIHGGIAYEGTLGNYTADPLRQYRQLMEIGFDGIKMLETKPSEIKRLNKAMDDPFYEDWFSALERDGTHVVWHVADPGHFWVREMVTDEIVELGWYYGDGTFPSQEEIYRQVLAVLDRHPNLNVTFAHFFFLSENPARLEEIFEKYSNVNVDVTPGGEMYMSFCRDWGYWREFFTRYADRIGFGTDSDDEVCGNPETADMVYRYLATPETQELWGIWFNGIDLEKDALEKILRGNFLRRVGKTPKPVNREALKAYIAEYRYLILDENLRKAIDDAAAEL